MSPICGNINVFYYLLSVVMQVRCKKSRTLYPVERSLSHGAPPIWGLRCSEQVSREELQDWEANKMSCPLSALQQLLLGFSNTRHGCSLNDILNHSLSYASSTASQGSFDISGGGIATEINPQADIQQGCSHAMWSAPVFNAMHSEHHQGTAIFQSLSGRKSL